MMVTLILLAIPFAVSGIVGLGAVAVYAAGRRRGWIEGWDDACQSQREIDRAYGRRLLDVDKLEEASGNGKIVPFRDTRGGRA